MVVHLRFSRAVVLYSMVTYSALKGCMHIFSQSPCLMFLVQRIIVPFSTYREG